MLYDYFILLQMLLMISYIKIFLILLFLIIIRTIILFFKSIIKRLFNALKNQFIIIQA